MYVYFLLAILIILMVCMIRVENNLYLIMYSFFFSLITASIYFIYNAPDLSLAEVSIGCGLVPLIYIIAVSKQKTFVVVVFRGVGRGELNDDKIEKQFEDLMNEFSDYYKLKLKIYHYKANYRPSRRKALREGHIDLLVTYNGKQNFLEIEGNSQNLMINRLKYLLMSYESIQLKEEVNDEKIF